MTLIVEPFRTKLGKLNGNYNAWFGGFEILHDVRTPYYDAARWLLKFGCRGELVLELQHKGSKTIAMRGRVGGMAKTAIQENRLLGPQKVPFADFPALPDSEKPLSAAGQPDAGDDDGDAVDSEGS
jgi:hypothetical protein